MVEIERTEEVEEQKEEEDKKEEEPLSPISPTLLRKKEPRPTLQEMEGIEVGPNSYCSAEFISKQKEKVNPPTHLV